MLDIDKIAEVFQMPDEEMLMKKRARTSTGNPTKTTRILNSYLGLTKMRRRNSLSQPLVPFVRWPTDDAFSSSIDPSPRRLASK